MSKRLMFDFKCNGCNAEFEDLVDPSERSIDCPRCGATAARQISAPRIDKLGMAMQEGMTGAIDYFEKVHRERKAIEERNYRNHGDYGSAPGSDGGTLTPESQAVAN